MADRFCCVKNCFNTRLTAKGLSFFRFPSDEARSKLWAESSGRPDLPEKSAIQLSSGRYLVCEKHFTNDQFVDFSSQKKELLRTAVPSILPPSQTGSKISRHLKGASARSSSKRRRLVLPSEAHIPIKKFRQNEEGNQPFLDLASASDVISGDMLPLSGEATIIQNETTCLSDPNEGDQLLSDAVSGELSSMNVQGTIALTETNSTPRTNEAITLGEQPKVDNTASSLKASTPVQTCTPSTKESSLPPNARFTQTCATPQTSLKKPTSGVCYTPRTRKLTRNTPRKNKLRRCLHKERNKKSRLSKRIKDLESKLRYLKSRKIDITDCLPEQLTASAKVFIKSQLQISSKKKKWKWWDEKEKKLALTLFFKSPHAYKMLRSIFTLPSISTLRRCLQKITVRPGISPAVFRALHKKVASMSELDRLCCISFDEMSLKSGLFYNSATDTVEGFETFPKQVGVVQQANHVMVFMLRGLFRKWKQPVAYFLVKDAATNNVILQMLNEILKEVLKVGLVVKTFVCDQNSNNRALFNKLGITADKPWTTYFSETKIFGLFDPPHLLKCIRDNLKKRDLNINGNLCKWQYIRQFYTLDFTKTHRLAPKLTARHIFLPNHSSMSVKLAAQIFSFTVGVAISNLVGYNILPVEASNTAELILLIDKWFDSLNSNQLQDTKKYRRAITEKSGHIQFLEDFLKNLTDWRFENKYIPTLTGMKLTTNAVICLWKDLQSTVKPKFLTTRQLNQDCLENMFAVVRSKGGYRERPIPSEFSAAFKNILINSLLKPLSKNKNCATDVEELLLELSDFYLESTCEKEQDDSSVTISTETSDASSLLDENMDQSFLECDIDNSFKSSIHDNTVDLHEESATVYIAGYLAHRLLKKNECNKCRDIVLSKEQKLARPEEFFLHLKAYETLEESDFGHLKLASPELTNFVKVARAVFKTEIEKTIQTKGVLSNLSRMILKAESTENVWENSICACKKDHKRLVLQMYLKVMIFAYIKKLNRDSACNNQSNGLTRKLKTILHK